MTTLDLNPFCLSCAPCWSLLLGAEMLHYEPAHLHGNDGREDDQEHHWRVVR